MAANYDNSAWFYDRLARLVYGKAIIRSQLYLLGHIPAGAQILIVGGGTGWLLEEITKRHPSGLKIAYVEISAKMMGLSRKRKTGANEVVYINGAVENIKLEHYDAIITPFLFDNFTENTLQKVFAHIHQTVKPNGIWLNNDFQLSGKWWQKLMLKTMLVFFRAICRIEATELPGIEKCFEKHGYKIIDQRTFYGDFILSRAYRK